MRPRTVCELSPIGAINFGSKLGPRRNEFAFGSRKRDGQVIDILDRMGGRAV
jgi:hypothetical protein